MPVFIELLVAAGLAAPAASSFAQSATATISGVQNGGIFDYTITLNNTGDVPLEGFWYGWTTSGNNLPSIPTNPQNSLGWGNSVFGGNSIMYQGDSENALAPNTSGIFTFESTSTPAEITTSPSGESVAYVGTINFGQNVPGDSTAVFSPVQVVPEPSSLALIAAGSIGLLAGVRRKTRQ
ncbi:MAG TPA: PEP-CTERM sorting domain-containing protein [Verrucomicrobiae bacterium]|nr:PEP-CTERM sorting domain-containing protein [Verrucomicrobiae bacterium]